MPYILNEDPLRRLLFSVVLICHGLDDYPCRVGSVRKKKNNDMQKHNNYTFLLFCCFIYIFLTKKEEKILFLCLNVSFVFFQKRQVKH